MSLTLVWPLIQSAASASHLSVTPRVMQLCAVFEDEQGAERQQAEADDHAAQAAAQPLDVVAVDNLGHGSEVGSERRRDALAPMKTYSRRGVLGGA